MHISLAISLETGSSPLESDARVSMHGFKASSIVTSAVYPEGYMFWAISADNIC
jgi:hypothetical protein